MELKVGFGRFKAMPETVMPLGGVGLAGREYTGVLDPLYITCVALTDEMGQTVLLYTQDFLKSEAYVIPMRQAVSDATGVPFDHIMLASTHTHAAPAVYYDKIQGVFAYREICTKAAIDAAKTALADRTPAAVGYTDFDGTGLAFSRHYVMADGSIRKTPGKKACPVAHADPPDDRGQLVRFTRQDKPDIYLVGFNVHPTFNGQYKQKEISADFPAYTRGYIEEKTGALVAYFTGAAGNQTGNSQLPDGQIHECAAYGALLGQRVLEAMNDLQPLEAAPIRIKTVAHGCRSNKDRIELINEANEIAQIHHKEGETEAVKALLQKYNIASPWEAYSIRVRYDAPETVNIPLSAMTLGGLSFVFAPFEMFGDHGKYIKAHTPGAMTFVVTCANESHGYILMDRAYDYDVYEKLVTRFSRGTGEQIAETFVEMVNDLQTLP